MKLRDKTMMLIGMFAILNFHTPCSGEDKKDILLTYAGFNLVNGEIFRVKGKKQITDTGRRILQFTVSPDLKSVVYVTNQTQNRGLRQLFDEISMWILNLKTGTIIQVGKDLSLKCCFLMNDDEARKRGHPESSLKTVNGSFWNERNEVLVHMVNENHEGIEFWLSMDGKLHGDI